MLSTVWRKRYAPQQENNMVILVRYAEIGLKSDFVRKEMENALIREITKKLIERRIEARTERDRGHIYIISEQENEIAQILTHTFGVASFSHCVKCGLDIDEIKTAVVEYVKEHRCSTFAIRARRASQHAHTSMEIAKIAGSAVQEHIPGLKVDLTNPELTIYVEVRPGGTYIYHEKMSGPGGLPYGTQGRVVAIIASERDTLAAWLMMKRGCRVFAIGKDDALVKPLNAWAHVNFENLEPTIDNAVKTARKRDARALISGMCGEELLEVLPEPCALPVFLPLSGFEPQQIETLRKVVMGV